MNRSRPPGRRAGLVIVWLAALSTPLSSGHAQAGGSDVRSDAEGALGAGGAEQEAWTVRSYGDSAPSTWRFEEELAVESPDWEPFLDLLVDGYGRLFVRTERPDRIRVLGRAGDSIRTFGESDGARTTELDDVRGMTWGPEGELWVVEGDRFAVFDTTGRHLRDVPRVSNANSRRWEGAGFDDGGRLWDKGYAGGAHDPVLLAIGSEGAVTDTIRLPFVVPRYFAPHAPGRLGRILRRGDTTAPRASWADSSRGDSVSPAPARAAAAVVARHPIPHSPEAIWAFDPEGAVWVARTDDYRVFRRRLDGDTILAIQRAARKRPVTPEEKLEIQRRLERRGEVPDTARIPSFKPVLESLQVDADGRLWVRLATGPGSPTVYDVYTRGGDYLARVEPGIGMRGAALVVRADTIVYVGHRPGTWPPPEPGDLDPLTNHAVRARLVTTGPGGTRAERALFQAQVASALRAASANSRTISPAGRISWIPATLFPACQ